MGYLVEYTQPFRGYPRYGRGGSWGGKAQTRIKKRGRNYWENKINLFTSTHPTKGIVT
jgi:hypothetical protein